MKKVLLAISLIITLASCGGNNNNGKVILTQSEYDDLLNKNTGKYPKPFELVGYDNFNQNNGILLGSDQHEYLVFKHNYSDEVMMHYIDCELCAIRKQQEFDLLVKTLKDTLK